MLLLHVSPARNGASIAEHGLLKSMSRGKRLAVWLVKPSRAAWAVLHTSQRHKVDSDEIILIEVNVTDLPLKCGPAPDTFYVESDIPASRLCDINTVSQYLEQDYDEEEDLLPFAPSLPGGNRRD